MGSFYSTRWNWQGRACELASEACIAKLTEPTRRVFDNIYVSNKVTNLNKNKVTYNNNTKSN